MFEKGSYVVKKMNKVCKIEDIVRIDEKSDKLYYLLIPNDEKNGKIYIPIERAELSLRPIMTKEEIDELISEIPDIKELDVGDERFREQKYKEILRSEDPKLLVGIIKMIYFRNKKREEQGKKCTATDQKYYNLAEDYLYSEIAFVLGKEKSEIRQIIEKSCKKVLTF